MPCYIKIVCQLLRVDFCINLVLSSLVQSWENFVIDAVRWSQLGTITRRVLNAGWWQGFVHWISTSPSESQIEEDRLLDFPESEASLIAKQAHSELLDRVANFCGLERGDPEQKRVMGMKHPNYHDPARATINLALTWHSVADKIADLNLKIWNLATQLNPGLLRIFLRA